MRIPSRLSVVNLALAVFSLATIDSCSVQAGDETHLAEASFVNRRGDGLKINPYGIFATRRLPCREVAVTLGKYFDNPKIETGLYLEGEGYATFSTRIVEFPENLNSQEGTHLKFMGIGQDTSECRRPNPEDILDRARRK